MDSILVNLGSQRSSVLALVLSAVRIGFSVEDVDAVTESLHNIGGKVVSKPKEPEWGRRAVLKDLDGHTVELVAPRQ